MILNYTINQFFILIARKIIIITTVEANIIITKKRILEIQQRLL